MTTIPSIPNGSSARSAAISFTRARTSSTVPAVTPGTAVLAVVFTPSSAARAISSLWASSPSRAAESASVPGSASNA